MSLTTLLTDLRSAGVALACKGDGLVVQAPAGAMTPALRSRLSEHKPALMAWLTGKDSASGETEQALPACVPQPADWRLPFPLSDMQLGFYMADDPYMEFHVRPHYYMENNRAELDIDAYEAAWNKALMRHHAEIVVVDREGRLNMVEQQPVLRIRRIELGAAEPAQVQAALARTREEMMRAELPLDRWPWVDLRVSSWTEGGVHRSRVHYNHNNFFSDGFGTTRLLQEIDRYYADPTLTLPPLSLSFRDAALALDRLAAAPAGQRARQYWEARLPGLPDSPPLPLVGQLDRRCRSQLQRRERLIAADRWSAFKERARSAGLTPSNALFTAYAELIAAWSNSRHFVLSNMMTRRLDLHPQMRDIVGNFASLYPLEVDFRADDRFVDRARRLQEQVLLDARHLQWGGMQVMQSLNRGKGGFGTAAIPFVVGSGLFMENFEKADFSCLETSQVLLDHQFWELVDGRLFIVWDLLEAFFLPGVVDAMWQAYAGLIERLATDHEAWQAAVLELQAQPSVERKVPAVPAAPAMDRRLEHGLDQMAQRTPHNVAVKDASGAMSYAALHAASEAIAATLHAHGVGEGVPVVIMAPRGHSLVQAVYGVLKAGGAYVPVDTALPEERRNQVLADCTARVVLTLAPHLSQASWPQGLTVLDIRAIRQTPPLAAPSGAGNARSLAYVIYTSGSTGRPKGVMIDHQGAKNTIDDVHRRFGVCAGDRLFGVSSFSFDLSVYDLFGAAAAGATLVYPDPEQALNPAHWLKLMQHERITVWNSAPPLAVLLCEAAEAQGLSLPDLRLVLLSGDWIPVDLPARLQRLAPQARVVSLGGATEASIWSICYPIDQVDPRWTSIPYGYPMHNQPWCVLDAWGRPAPVWTTGELHIGGIGLALGYWGDVPKTAAAFGRFARSGPLAGERIYRTGDMGRYRDDGSIEFLGRRDTQVKIQGHRIELAEVEIELARCESVQSVVASVLRASPQGAARLVAHVVPAPGYQPNVEALKAHLARTLPHYMVPSAIGVIPSIPLSANGKVDRSGLPPIGESQQGTTQERLQPRTQTEAKLLPLWCKVLGREHVDLCGDFFDIGGQSFEAVRLIGAVQHELGHALTLGLIWELRSIERIALHLDTSSGAAQERQGITLRASGQGARLYLMHPAGGQVMAYRQLAGLLDRPVTAFEAVGLTGQEAVLDSIPELARRYVDELLKDAPQGPLQLCGWSSGALIAFEAAAQLRQRGHAVASVVLIDCPAPVMPPGETDDATLLGWFLEDLHLDLPGELVRDAQRFVDAGAGDAESLARVAQALHDLGHAAASTLKDLLAVYRVFKGIVRGSRRYAPSAIDVDLLLIRAREGAVSEFAAHRSFEVPDWGWAELSTRQVRSELHHGNHHTLLLPPQLEPVAAAIDTWLNRG